MAVQIYFSFSLVTHDDVKMEGKDANVALGHTRGMSVKEGRVPALL